MNKKRLAEDIAKRISSRAYLAYNFVDLLIEVVGENLAKGNKIVLPGFGSWWVKAKRAKRVLHPRSKEPLIIAPTKVVKFVPSENLCRILQK